MAGTPIPRSLALLGALRRRRRMLRNVGGLLRLVTWLVALVWLSFLLDWGLDLPWGIRVLHLVVGAVLVFLGVRVLWFGPRRRLSEDQLAVGVENALGTLDQSLITAVQLNRPDNPRAAFYSPALLARTTRQAEQQVQGVRVDRLLTARSLVVALMAAVAVLTPMLVLASVRKDLASTYVKRNLLLSEVAWPRQYLFELRHPPQGQTETLLAMGEPLTVEAVKLRGGSARVFLRVEYASDEMDLFPLERRGDDHYRKVFRNVTSDFRMRVEGGDYRGEWHRIAVRLRPRIEEIELAYEYPGYIGIEAGADAGLGLGGHVKVPVGTTVSYRARTSLPVVSATWIESAIAGDEEPRRQELAVEEGHILAGSFVATRNGYYQFDLESEDGFRNEKPIRYRISVIPDHAPEVYFIEPGKNLEVSPGARLTLVLEARDDHGVGGENCCSGGRRVMTWRS